MRTSPRMSFNIKAGQEKDKTLNLHSTRWKHTRIEVLQSCGSHEDSLNPHCCSAFAGWPSFFDLVNKDSITLTDDFSYGIHRVETTCSQVQKQIQRFFFFFFNYESTMLIPSSPLCSVVLTWATSLMMDLDQQRNATA